MNDFETHETDTQKALDEKDVRIAGLEIKLKDALRALHEERAKTWALERTLWAKDQCK